MPRSIIALVVWLTAAVAAGGLPLGMIVFEAHRAQPNQLPDGWKVKELKGQADVATVTDEPGTVLRLRSQNSSFSLERAVYVDLAKYPYMSWQWKVTQLPRGGDFRRLRTDDQAAQVMVAFSDRHILTYIWDTSAPKDLMQSASPVPLLHLVAVVCRSGPVEMNRWIVETRNLAADYERAYGRRISYVKGLRLQINSQHTNSSAESYFGDVVFHATAQ
ncbi:MAG: DUF3047 domain-containing protein [Acidobacteriales bacterium]|nr:DUF3047 domain-containing protein [Terriglobales bacterium]